jgi:hypothetical protein
VFNLRLKHNSVSGTGSPSGVCRVCMEHSGITRHGLIKTRWLQATKGGPKMGFYSASSHSRCQGIPNHNRFNSYRPSLVFRVKKHAILTHLDNIYVGWKESGDGECVWSMRPPFTPVRLRQLIEERGSFLTRGLQHSTLLLFNHRKFTAPHSNL